MPISKQHILILGGTGFIGKAFYNQLVTQKNVHIHLLVRNKAKLPDPRPNVTLYDGDIQTFNWSSLTHSPDVVFHFARINSSRGKALGRRWAALKGKKANQRLLKYLEKQNKPVKLFYLSGSLMYGNHSDVIKEDQVLNPISFAREYVIAEKPFIAAQDKNIDVKITLVRVPWVLGNGSWFQAFFKQFLTQHQQVPQYGDGLQEMSFITVSDLASCLVHLPNTAYRKVSHISYSESLTQAAFVKLIAHIIGLPVQQILLSNSFERAVVEAFTSNIKLGTHYADFDPILPQQGLHTILEGELRPLLEDI